jgi:hypothetical protein
LACLVAYFQFGGCLIAVCLSGYGIMSACGLLVLGSLFSGSWLLVLFVFG